MYGKHIGSLPGRNGKRNINVTSPYHRSTPTHRYRLSALAIILGAILTLPVAYLFLLTHGPYEQALNHLVWGLDHHDYSRWAVFPALLILPGLQAFHLWQRDAYGKAGLWDFRLAFGGFALATFGQIWDYVLFDPWEHPMHGVGFFLQLLAVLMIFVGLPLWAVAIVRGRTLVGWQLAIPILCYLYAFWLFVSISTNDENWFFPRFVVGTGFVADIFLSITYILILLRLWSIGEE